MENQLIDNKVTNSKLVTIDLEDYCNKEEKAVYDISSQLFQGLILREKDFRNHIKETDWSNYSGKHVAIICSVDAIVPTWAYMLVAANLNPHAKDIFYGSVEEFNKYLLQKNISNINTEEYKDAKVVIKGCGDLNLSAFAYVEVVKKLQPYCSSIMYGEPCSTVPVYKKKKLQSV